MIVEEFLKSVQDFFIRVVSLTGWKEFMRIVDDSEVEDERAKRHSNTSMRFVYISITINHSYTAVRL